jgi:hypothetical protein
LEQRVGFREQLNQKPIVTGGVILALVVLLLIYWVFSLVPRHPSSALGGEFYFTSDDGKTWFADDASKIPPFDHDGSQAVRCYVFKADDSPPFAGYLEMYTSAVHDYLTGGTRGTGPPIIPSQGTLVKKPGAKQWVSELSPSGQKISNITGPNGSAVDPVLP